MKYSFRITKSMNARLRVLVCTTIRTAIPRDIFVCDDINFFSSSSMSLFFVTCFLFGRIPLLRFIFIYLFCH